MANQHFQNQEENFSFGYLLNIFWRKKLLIGLGTFLSVLLVVLLLTFLPKTYNSKAIISVSEFHRINNVPDQASPPPTGLSSPKYNNFLIALESQNKLLKFLKLNNYDSEEIIPTVDLWNWRVSPVYAFEEKSKRKKDNNFVVSLRVSATANQPASARKRALWIGNYSMTLLLNSEIQSYFGSLRSKLDSSIAYNGQRIDDAKVEISDLKEKETFIINQILKIPGAAKISEMDVTKINHRTEKYLSPHQQLVAVKIEIKDKEITIKNFERRILDNQVLLKYLEEVMHLFDSREDFLLKEDLLGNIKKVTRSFFTEEKIKEYSGAYYRIAVQLANFTKLRDVVYRFETLPSQPLPVSRFGRKKMAIIVFIFSLFFFSFLALLLEWIKKNRKVIFGDTNTNN